jgi:hypothetical protein
MANEEHLAILRKGVDVWNAWREANPGVWPDLCEADIGDVNLVEVDFNSTCLDRANLTGAHLIGAVLIGATLIEAHLDWADLTGANLDRANLTGAVLNNADLTGADITSAVLRGANLIRVDLTGANLTRVDLCDANLTEATLSETNFTGAMFHRAIVKRAVIGQTIFAGNDLRDVIGITEASHYGPSSIDIDTLVQSGGKIPGPFLRRCGVPDSIIENLPALIGAMQPIQFYSCFISYSTKDKEFAKRLHGRMRDSNLRVWFANEDLKGGHKLHEQIDEAIRVYDKFIIVLSPESLRSKWVMNEVRRTRKAELASRKRKFFPIALMDYKELEDWECIDPTTGTDLAAEIREYYVPDFRDWKNHDSFEKAFTQLLEGLKAVDAPPAPRLVTPNTQPPPIDYEQGLVRLRGMIIGHSSQLEFATLEARLLGILHEEQLHGSSENTRVLKSQVIHSFNQLVISSGLGASFTNLCH